MIAATHRSPSCAWSVGLHGNDIADGSIAAAVKAMRGHMVTFDNDFSSLLDRRQLTVLSV